MRNVNDGISVFNVAEGTLGQLSNIVTGLKELATQAANGTYSFTQRSALDAQAKAMTDEYNRLVGSTDFNRQKLLDGSLSYLGVQAGIESAAQIGYAIGSGLKKNIDSGNFTATTTAGTFGSVSSADVNGDGIADKIVIDGSGAAVVSLGSTSGTFTTTATVGSGAISSKTGDFNGDGKLDLITVGTATKIAFGNGDGTFGSQTTLSSSAVSGSPTEAIAIADFNGDNVLDVAVLRTPTTVSMILNKGDGTFNAATTITGFTSANALAAGDLNGDGKADLVTTRSTLGFDFRLGNGNGTFGAATYQDTQNVNSDVVVADFNHDGIMDVATNDNGSILHAFLGSTSGTLRDLGTTIANYAGDGVQLSVNDFNGDGIPDIALSGNTNLDILTGRGDGTFSVSSSQTVSTGGWITTGDFNGDGAIDIITSDQVGDSALNTYTAVPTTVTTIQRFNLLSQADAKNALSLLTAASTRISNELSGLGSTQSRLSTASTLISSIREAYSSAASKIMDADVASESAQLAANKIKQQTGEAILAQANLQPEIALQLLRGI